MSIDMEQIEDTVTQEKKTEIIASCHPFTESHHPRISMIIHKGMITQGVKYKLTPIED